MHCLMQHVDSVVDTAFEKEKTSLHRTWSETDVCSERQRKWYTPVSNYTTCPSEFSAGLTN